MLDPLIAAWVFDAAGNDLEQSWQFWVVAVIVVVVTPLLGRKIQLMRARAWPTTMGQVESRCVRDDRRGNGTVTIGEVAYSYHVNGEYHAGFLTNERGRESALEAWTQRFAIGQSVMIRYDPKRPHISVLDERDQIAMIANTPS